MTTQEKQLVDHLIFELQGRHNDLKNQLSTEFPHLTENDLRLCILLRSSISTKEIATLLNIVPDSVKKAKHRLRKKIHIAPTTQWKDFFNKLERKEP